MRPIRLAALAGTARPDLAELVESGGAEICYVENTHPPGEVARCQARPGYVGSAPLAGTSRKGSIC